MKPKTPSQIFFPSFRQEIKAISSKIAIIPEIYRYNSLKQDKRNFLTTVPISHEFDQAKHRNLQHSRYRLDQDSAIEASEALVIIIYI